MGLTAFIGRVKEFVRSEENGEQVATVKVDQLDDVNTAQADHMDLAGVETNPFPEDAVCVVDVGPNGSTVSYADTRSEPEGEQGETVLYGRSDVATRKCRWILKKDGTIEGTNENGNFALEPGGDCKINGATITADGNVVTAGGVSLDKHTHGYEDTSDAGTASLETDPPS